MFKPREGHNAKARRSTAGGSRKKGKRRTSTVESTAQEGDPNVTVLVPKSKEEKDTERRERLRKEVVPSDIKMTSKKRKRLDNYIEKKLKQEERVVILKKLEKSQAELNSAALQSSSTLGTGKTSTHFDRLAQNEHKKVKKAIEGHVGRRRNNAVGPSAMQVDSSESDIEVQSETDVPHADTLPRLIATAPRPVGVVDAPPPLSVLPAGSAPLAVGSALRRNADGSAIAPRIVQLKPKGQKTAFQSWKSPRSGANANEESDTSFDSSDSGDDATEERHESDGDNSSHSEGDSGSSSSSSGSEEPSEDEAKPNPSSGPRRRKPGAFKAWAMKQLSASKEYIAPPKSGSPPQASGTLEEAVEASLQTDPPAKRQKLHHKNSGTARSEEVRGPLGEDLVIPATAFAEQFHRRPEGQFTVSNSSLSTVSARKSKAVLVQRPPDVAEARLDLPIVAEEQPIMEAIMLNPVVVICGETGSGKTTQVPQFLYESGFGSPSSDNPGMIGITQPRRVAAMAMASRVAHELSLSASRVSYQIRYDATTSPSTVIKFMTDGVLLRELATDFLLNKYSVIIIDEAHERSLNTDILIGVLSRVVKLREDLWKEGNEGAKPLRLIIMSATLRVSDFTQNTSLFPSPPPVLTIAARQHPVTVHFSRRTSSDYVGEAVRKAAKVHARLPPGGILIFLTGQNEINGVCRKLEEKFGQKALEEKRRRRSGGKGIRYSGARPGLPDTGEDEVGIVPADADVEPEEYDLGTDSRQDQAFDVDDGVDGAVDSDALDSDAEGLDNETLRIDAEETDLPMDVVPLYSLLPSEKQMRVFDAPSDDARLVVVATNVAETSLTIPGIRYVIDCGRGKERRYDVANGIQSFQVSWISKASAAQRAGRAGRTGPGHCYRLYSSALYEHYFDQFAQPELLRVPIEGVVLQMKGMHIDAVVNFPFPTPPDRTALRKAETVLTHLGALSPQAILAKGSNSRGNISGGQITELGRSMSLFPVSPRFSRMLVSGRQHDCMPYIIAIVSLLSVGDPFLREEMLQGDDQEGDELNDELAHITSDAVKVREARKQRRKAFYQSQHTHSSLGDFTSDVFRVLSVVGAYEFAGGGQIFCSEHFVRPKAMEEIHKLRAQISHIAQTNFPTFNVRFSPNLIPPTALQLKVLRQLLTAAFIDQVAVRKDLTLEGSGAGTQYATSSGVAYRALGIDDDVFIHPASVLFNRAPPDYVVFSEVVRTSRLWLKGLTVINPAWLSTLGKPSLCTFSKPVKDKQGKEMVVPRFGPGWNLPPVPAQKAK